MNDPKLVFEPITHSQALFLEVLSQERRDLSQNAIDTMIKDLADIPCISSLSKQEASFLIDTLRGTQEWDRPRAPRTEDRLGEAGPSLPFYKQIYALRKHVKELGWSVEQFSRWLLVHAKVDRIDKLDREKTRAAYTAMVHLLQARN